jgi:hypothetical protein
VRIPQRLGGAPTPVQGFEDSVAEISERPMLALVSRSHPLTPRRRDAVDGDGVAEGFDVAEDG